MVKNLSFHLAYSFLPGGGNGNPLQYSHLEKTMDNEPGGLQSIGSQRVRHNEVTNTHTDTHMNT